MAQQAKKSKAGEKIRIQVVLDKKVVEEIDDFAEKMNMTRSFFTATLITDAMNDNRWMHKFVTSRLAGPLRALAEKLVGDKTKAEKKEYERKLKELEDEND